MGDSTIEVEDYIPMDSTELTLWVILSQGVILTPCSKPIVVMTIELCYGSYLW